MIRCVLLCLLAYACVVPAHAQGHRIIGSCRDIQQRPIAYVGVTLLSLPDSSALATDLTDDKGQFTIAIDKMPSGDYVLIASLLGYKIVRQSLAHYEAQSLIEVPTLTLVTEQTQLGEVVVEGRPPLIEVQGDKLILNVGSSVTQAGLNGLELMAKVPGVLVNRSNQQVTLRNRAPLIMIDGRPTYLTPEQMSQRLRTMRSDEIATIEVIQNPSARYEAAGTAGIINIRTKQAQHYGSLYTLQLGGAYGYFGDLGSTPQHNETLNYSQRGRRASIYASIDNSDSRFVDKTLEEQSLLQANTSFERRSNSYQTRSRSKIQRLTANTEWYISPQTTVSLQAQQTWNRSSSSQRIQQLFFRPSDSSGLDTEQDRQNSFLYSTVNAQLQHRFDSLGRQLTFDVDWARVTSEASSAFVFRQYGLDNPVPRGQTSNYINNPFTNPIYASTIAYVHPGTREQSWETGAKLSITENRNIFSTDFVRGQPSENRFDFRETISAVYAQWSGKLAAYKLQAGLRAEQTNAKGLDQNDVESVNRSYLNVFPSASLTRAVGAKQQITLAYSRRIERPSYYRYNPFQRFSSLFEYTQGNPSLNPAITNTYSVRHVFKDAVVTTFSYDRVAVEYSAFFSLDRTTNPGETLIRTTWVNTFPSQVAWYNLNGSIPVDPYKWLHLDLSYWYNYQVYKNKVEDVDINFTASSFGANVVASIKLPKSITAEVSSYTQSGNPMGAFERSQPQVQVDFGIRKTLSKHRGDVKLNLSDPFNLYRYRNRINSPDLISTSWSRGTNRLISLQLTYHIGNNEARTNSRSSSSQELRNRSRRAP